MEDFSLNVFTRIGLWVEKHFPEKMITTEVMAIFSNLGSEVSIVSAMVKDFAITIPHLVDQVSNLESQVKKLTEQIETLRTNVTIKTRVAGSAPDTMTPFATRLPPVQPATANANKPHEGYRLAQ